MDVRGEGVCPGEHHGEHMGENVQPRFLIWRPPRPQSLPTHSRTALSGEDAEDVLLHALASSSWCLSSGKRSCGLWNSVVSIF